MTTLDGAPVEGPIPPGADILLVDDDPAAIQVLARMLAGVAALRFATSGTDALRLVRERAPDLILLDAEMPGMSGFQVCEAIKDDPTLSEIAVIFVTSHFDLEFQVSGFDAGAADFISKPISGPLVLARVKCQLRAKQLADELRRVSTIDALTGVANRRAFDATLEREWLRGRRAGDPIALLAIDVDHFKRYNDRYGHPAGDACLKAVAQALGAGSRRPADLLARVGGEEFALLLPSTSRAGAVHVASHVLETVAALRWPHADSPTAEHVSVSIGIGCYDELSACWVGLDGGPRTSDEAAARRDALRLVQAADVALYAAKHAGRMRAMLRDLADGEIPPAGSPPVPPGGAGPAAQRRADAG